MINHFTHERRTELLENMLTFLSKDEQVAGVIKIGSTSKEFRDNYSGITLIIVVKNEPDTTDVYTRWKTKMDTLFSTLYTVNLETGPRKFHICSLLEDYLLLDITVAAIAHLRGVHPPYHIAFDTTGLIEKAVERKAFDPAITDNKLTYTGIMQSVWQPLMHSVVALKRNEIWRTLHYLNILREKLFLLAGMHHEMNLADYREAEELPEMLLVQLRHTLPTTSTATSIRRALRTTMTLLFAEAETLDQKYGVTIGKDMEEKLMPYMETYG